MSTITTNDGTEICGRQRQSQRDAAGQALAVFMVDRNETELTIPFGKANGT
jgi:hypothetical protein